jgi:hypothetical protein
LSRPTVGIVSLKFLPKGYATFFSISTPFEINSVQSQYWINLFFPGSDYTAEEFVDKLKADSIDAILVVYPEGAGIKSNFIPQITQSNTKGTAYTNPYGQTSYNSKTTTYSSGGYYVDKPWAKATAELYDAKTGTMIWMASINSRGNAFADFKLLAKSMGTKIVQKLAADGIIH